MSGISLSNSAKTKLTKLDIVSSSSNKLSGEINISDFNNLNEITIRASGITKFTGSKSLETLKLYENDLLSFPVLSTLEGMKSLTINNDNKITGSIPSFSANNSLDEIDLGYNSFNGIVSLTGNDTPNLSRIILSNNSFVSRLPELKSFPSLKYADFRNQVSPASFIGDLPALSSNTKLKEIYFNGNPELSGFLPELSACQDLTNINFIKLGLSGRIHDFEKTPNLETYHAFQNHMTGQLPILSACPNLITMDLNQNYLSGGIPFINNLTKLKLLNLQNNGLSGHFPDITNLSSLEFLRFNKNDRNGSDGIIGEIPDLSGCPNLKILDIAENALSGWNGTVWPSIQFNNIQVQNNLLSQGEVDRILAAINATGLSKPVGASGYLVNLAGTGNAAPTNGDSNADVVDLRAKGWQVDIN